MKQTLAFRTWVVRYGNTVWSFFTLNNVAVLRYVGKFQSVMASSLQSTGNESYLHCQSGFLFPQIKWWSSFLVILIHSLNWSTASFLNSFHFSHFKWTYPEHRSSQSGMKESVLHLTRVWTMVMLQKTSIFSSQASLDRWSSYCGAFVDRCSRADCFLQKKNGFFGMFWTEPL